MTRFWPLAIACSALASCGSESGGELGQGTFAYECPNAEPGGPNPDAYCDANPGAQAIPDVATGAGFRLSFSQAASVQPAVSSLASAGPQGWAIQDAGWLGFVAWSGQVAADYTHVHALAVGALAWQSDPAMEALAVGAPVTVAVVPRAEDGSTLGGVLACSFASSDPAVSVASGGGRSARLTATAAGTATITAACAGLSLSASVRAGAGE
jgi:hypothetical protein